MKFSKAMAWFSIVGLCSAMVECGLVKQWYITKYSLAKAE